MADVLGVGKEFIDSVLAKIPEAHRGAVAAAFADPEAAPALQAIGEGTLRQADYSRQLDATMAHKRKLDDWWAANEPLVKKGKEALARETAGDPDPTNNPNPANLAGKGFLSREEALKIVDEREMGAGRFIITTQSLALKHLHEFNEVLDLNALLNDPRVNELGLERLYQTKYAERYQKKAQAAEDTRINGIVEAKVAEERKKFASRPPYPVSPNDPGSPLDVLEAKQADTGLVDEASQMYMGLVQGAGAPQ